MEDPLGDSKEEEVTLIKRNAKLARKKGEQKRQRELERKQLQELDTQSQVNIERKSQEDDRRR